ncbi:MAG: glycosyltransferase family 2 protein [Verrucomicrobiales bacterium]|nr:glycosyltransferase family 2 protein [Verrucomicrobiales bacterium]
MPVISVITSCLNPDPQDFSALRSLEAQTLLDFEWIVVDDGSEPDRGEWFEALQNQKKVVVKVLRLDQNSGQAVARNRAISVAQGEWIVVLDSDDALEPDFLERMLEAARNAQNSKVLMFACTKHVFVESSRTWINHPPDWLKPDPIEQLSILLHRPFLSHCGVFFSNHIICDLGMYDESLVSDEDGDLLIRVLFEGYHFQPVSNVHYLYRHCRKSGDRVSVNDSLDKIDARLRVCNKVLLTLNTREFASNHQLRAGLAKRIDNLALSAWSLDRQRCRDLLGFANDVCPNYEWSGTERDRVIRQFVGVAGLAFLKRVGAALRNL